MLKAHRAKCGACRGELLVLHAEWDGGGGKLLTPGCRHCGCAWHGYYMAEDFDLGEALAVWDEKGEVREVVRCLSRGW